MKVAITGERGFLGYHLTQYYKWVKGDQVVSLSRDYIDNIKVLKDCDLLIHCAAVHRGNNVYESNINMAKDLVNSLQDNQININIKYTSSIQIHNDTAYGKSKKEVSLILKDYCSKSNLLFEEYLLPNLFGVFGKPNHTSFINTFCYNVVNGLEIKYNSNEVNLCYVYDAIDVIDNKEFAFKTTNITVKEVYNLIVEFHLKYQRGEIPSISSKFHRNLFNVYRSFASPINDRVRYSDKGNLVKHLKSKNMESQIFFSTIIPGITRFNHFHFNKVERFYVLSGDAKIDMRQVGTNDVKSFTISGENNVVIDVPVLYTYNITNVGITELVCVFWRDEFFDVNNPDTYSAKV